MLYKIQYNYNTGDSYNNYNYTSVLELTWNNLDIAKENLKRIQQHYNYYKELHNYQSRKSRELLIKDNSYFPWFVNIGSLHEHCLILITDDGNNFQLSAPWCGHFESLNSVEIIIEDTELKIVF